MAPRESTPPLYAFYTSVVRVCARAALVGEEETGMFGRAATQACEDVVS